MPINTLTVKQVIQYNNSYNYIASIFNYIHITNDFCSYYQQQLNTNRCEMFLCKVKYEGYQ